MEKYTVDTMEKYTVDTMEKCMVYKMEKQTVDKITYLGKKGTMWWCLLTLGWARYFVKELNTDNTSE